MTATTLGSVSWNVSRRSINCNTFSSLIRFNIYFRVYTDRCDVFCIWITLQKAGIYKELKYAKKLALSF